MKQIILAVGIFFALLVPGAAQAQFSQKQLGQWLKRFPQADTNGDGKLSAQEANAFRKKLSGNRQRGGGVPREFPVDPGWDADAFPEHAICYLDPEEIANAFGWVKRGNEMAITRYDKPADDSLRIVATGHSFMAPGFATFPKIAKAAGLQQPPLLTHTGGGITGSARYKWEQENGIFQFDKRPTPKLLASICNAHWDAMMWGPYYKDRPEYYACWIDFCLKYNPDMKFYLADAWPQLEQLASTPSDESELTTEVVARLGQERFAENEKLINTLNEKYPDRVFVLPTCEAMVLAVDYYHQGKLPGIEGIHTAVGKKQRSLWRDRLGHLGPGLGQLEGYVFYATMYGRSPELIGDEIEFSRSGYPSPDLDRVFRKIAWEAVLKNPLSGVTDEDGNQIGDRFED